MIFIVALCPDMVLKYVTEENPGEDNAWVMPSTEAVAEIVPAFHGSGRVSI